MPYKGLWGSSEAPQGRALSLDEACAEILKALSGDCWAVLANMLHWCTRQCLRNGWLSCWFPLFKKGIQESSPIIGVSHCSSSKVKLMQGRLKEGSDLLILSNWGGAIQTLYWTWSSGAALCSCRVTRGVMEDSPSSLWLGDGLIISSRILVGDALERLVWAIRSLYNQSRVRAVSCLRQEFKNISSGCWALPGVVTCSVPEFHG